MKIRLLYTAALLLIGATATAQTTVTLTTPPAASGTTIRGGTYAGINFNGDLLVTKASGNPTYVRRALLDFDTDSTIPAGATIDSATLTLTVHSGGAAASRLIGVYPMARPFVSGEATWDIAANNSPWTTPGGDFGPLATSGNVPNTDGAQASFDVTALVQAAVSPFGSRRTQLALVDIDSMDDAQAGYREYYAATADTASASPVLVVTFRTQTATSLPSFSHVFVIIFENHEYDEVIGNAAAPFFNALAQNYGIATNYDGIMHPSLPNYMALTGGETVFTTDCAGCTTAAASIADQVEQSGRTWRAYMEKMPAPCTTTDDGTYAQKHNPFIHYSVILDDTQRCQANVIPKTPLLGHLSSGDVANYTWITPNLCNDMHDCAVDVGDAWLNKYVTAILASPAWDANSVIFITFDEGTSSTGGGGRIPLIVVSPRTRGGTVVSAPYNHYNLLATVEESWGLARLGEAADAAIMREFFNQ
ncbi:MAG TPA: alkaline phosphatase family protein [Vicinamibacterales bacterium]|nr:alkaline phosphatase family protein [Vicinamibacterales bacterium]